MLQLSHINNDVHLNRRTSLSGLIHIKAKRLRLHLRSTLGLQRIIHTTLKGVTGSHLRILLHDRSGPDSTLHLHTRLLNSHLRARRRPAILTSRLASLISRRRWTHLQVSPFRVSISGFYRVVNTRLHTTLSYVSLTLNILLKGIVRNLRHYQGILNRRRMTQHAIYP